MRHPLFIFFLFLLTVSSARAQADGQKKESNFSLSLEMASKYMWRGIEYGDAPTLFPSINYEYKGFSAYAMGGYAVNGSHQEVDLGIGYTHDWLFIGVADYYYPTSVGTKDKYFELSNRDTGHYIEAYAILTPSFAPIWLTLSSYVFGADKNTRGNQAYSSYAELGYKFVFKGDNCLSFMMGAALNKSFYTDYEKGFNVVNIGCKYETSLKLGKFNLPISGSYIINPYKEKSFVTLSVYLNS